MCICNVFKVNSLDSMRQLETIEDESPEESAVDDEAEHILKDKPWLRTSSGTEDLGRSPTIERLDSQAKLRLGSSSQELIAAKPPEKQPVEHRPNPSATKNPAKSMVIYESNV